MVMIVGQFPVERAVGLERMDFVEVRMDHEAQADQAANDITVPSAGAGRRVGGADESEMGPAIARRKLLARRSRVPLRERMRHNDRGLLQLQIVKLFVVGPDCS